MSSKRKSSTKEESNLPVVGKKYTSDVPQIILDTYNSGQTVAHVCVKLGISKTTFYEWIKIYPEMKEAYECAKAAQEVYYLDVGKDAMFGHIENFNTKMYQILVQNQLKWGLPDQPQANQQINVKNLQINQMSTQELENQLMKQLQKTGLLAKGDVIDNE